MPKIYLTKADTDKHKKLQANKFLVIANYLKTKADEDEKEDKACIAVDEDDYGKGPDDQDGDEADREAKADLDTPTENKGNHTIVPPKNKIAAPEDADYQVSYDPPSRKDMNPSSADDKEFDMTDEGDDKACAYISEEERQRVPDENCAGKNKSFPIRNGNDVKNASRLVGHSPNPSETKRRIIEIAHRLGLEKSLPESWRKPDRMSKAYDKTLELLGKLSADEKKILADKLQWEEISVNGPQENA